MKVQFISYTIVITLQSFLFELLVELQVQRNLFLPRKRFSITEKIKEKPFSFKNKRHRPNKISKGGPFCLKRSVICLIYGKSYEKLVGITLLSHWTPCVPVRT